MIEYESDNRSEQFYLTMYDLWKQVRLNFKHNVPSFDEMMVSNKSRADFILYVLELSKNGDFKINNDFQKLIDSSYEFLIDYELGKYEGKQLVIPSDLLSDLSDIRYVPRHDELSNLLDLVRINNEHYKRNLCNMKMVIELPNNTLHSKITEELEIGKDKLAHLLGITSNKSGLVKLFVDYDKKSNPHYYDVDGNIIDNENNGIAVRIVDFYSSDLGRNMLLNLNDDIVSFVKEDMLKHENQYTHNMIKKSCLKHFKNRFFTKFGFDFPLLEYNKMFVKNVSFLNYSNLSFVSEIIVDYENPNSESFKSDKFLVHYSNRNIYLKKITKYLCAKEEAISFIKKVSSCPESLRNKLLNMHSFLESRKDLVSMLIPNYSRLFLDKYHIKDFDLEDQFKKFDKDFDNDIWDISRYPGEVDVLGFITDSVTKEDSFFSGRLIKTSKCETSQNKRVFDLVNNFYVHGRRYFIDKIYGDDGMSNTRILDKVLKVSTIPEEISFMEIQSVLNPDDKCKEDILALKKRETDLMNVKREYAEYLIGKSEFNDDLDDKDNPNKKR